MKEDLKKVLQTDDDYYDHFHLCFGYGRDLDFRQLAAGKRRYLLLESSL